MPKSIWMLGQVIGDTAIVIAALEHMVVKPFGDMKAAIKYLARIIIATQSQQGRSVHGAVFLAMEEVLYRASPMVPLARSL